MEFFRSTTIPRSHQQHFIALQARWLSWDDSVIRFFKNFGKQVDHLAAPAKISVNGCSPYESSYSYRLSRLDRSLGKQLLRLAESLLSFPPGTRLNLLTGMLDPPLSTSRLAKFVALLRAGIVRLTGDPRCALNAPVYAARHDDGFPLHADLFLTERLLLVFDDVPPGRSGASLFLPMRTLLDIAGRIQEMPQQTADRLRHLVKDGANRDSFDEFYKLLYSENNPWQPNISRALRLARFRTKLRRGEGYFIDDRHWLHGREPLNGAVSPSRFRRLVFGLLSGSTAGNRLLNR
jgi:hypothetical protein